MNLSFRQLRVFLEVAQRGGVTAAAQALHLTPPAVSMQIKELENQVGLQLFDRQGRTLTLSTAGEYFVVHAKRMLGALRDTENGMARFKKLEHGLLTVGMVSTAKYFVPRLLGEFRRDHPGIDVRLRVANNREALVTQMEAGEVDLSIMGRPPAELATRSEAFAPHPLVFVCPPEHPLLRIGHPPLAALAPFPFIVREHGSGTRNAMERFFADHGFEPRITMEMSSNEAIKQAVMADMGISFLSLHTLGLELRQGLLHRVDVEGTPVMRTWHVVHLQSKVLSPAAEAFRYFTIERGTAMLAEHDAPLLSLGTL
ncbi:MAG: LysR family transcriptional regulator [Hydrogenophaga sp.]|uniref:LysR family transcriptional regulator n=1 Tax=Hydrogenophaga sp. TaxID=1904254 RepID=UPI001D461083|nr:LysR family transcriptional regulator [Hydrogenophaga sp.]MBX3608474.1 LysR family transcriptional regulator [Hydrogenophaga sp.]